MEHRHEPRKTTGAGRFLALAWLCFLAGGGDDLGNRVAQGLRRISVPGEQPAEVVRVAETTTRVRLRSVAPPAKKPR